jgi:hypothetical protein
LVHDKKKENMAQHDGHASNGRGPIPSDKRVEVVLCCQTSAVDVGGTKEGCGPALDTVCQSER